MNNPFDIAGSVIASVLTTPRGLMSDPARSQPARLISLYEMENCPHCRVVREALTRLDLDAMILPCPKGGERYRPEAVRIGGKAQFPLLVDTNTNTVMYESIDIVHYLYKTYAGRKALPKSLMRAINRTAASFASAVRMNHGIHVRPSRQPAKPLELFSFETSPFARLVRERLSEMEISYRLRSMGKSKVKDLIPPAIRRTSMPDYEHTGRNRELMFERMGHVQVPLLIDPNTGVEMFESSDIIDYLQDTYGQ